MASFISLFSDEEQIQDLAKFITRLQNKGKETPVETYQQEITKLAQEKNFTEVLTKLLDEHAILFAEGTEKDLESFFLVIVALITKLGGTKTQDLLNKAITVLTVKDDKTLLRLKILNNIYNIVTDNTFRFHLYLSILQYSISSHTSEIMIREFNGGNNLNKRIKQLDLSTEQKRTLYKVVREILKESGRSVASFSYGVKFLSTFDKPDPSVSKDAANIILEAIRIPEILQFDSLLELPVVKQLENSSEHGKLFQLLKIYVSDNIDAYKHFVKENASLMSSLDLKEDECILKMRLLSLATLGAAQTEIPYSLIAQTLQIDESEVESWIIIAISESVVEAKMDQLKRVVSISRCLHRVFTKTQWKQLAENLNTWKNNTKSLLKTLSDTKQQYLNALQQVQSHKQ